MIAAMIEISGIAVLAFLGLYILLGMFRYYLLRFCDEAEAYVNGCDMPVLRPIPIPTKKQPSWLHKVAVSIFDVRQWALVENWHYKLKLEDGESVEIVIPKGFCFDGASIPRILWALLSPIGTLLIPGLIHDYGYRHNFLWKVGKNGQIEEFMKNSKRADWDNLFKNINKDVNAMPLISLLTSWAVSIGGGCAWNKHRKNEAQYKITKPDLSEVKIPCP